MSYVNLADREGDTPLHWAVILDDKNAVKFLLANNARMNLKNNQGNNVIMIACIN